MLRMSFAALLRAICFRLRGPLSSIRFRCDRRGKLARQLCSSSGRSSFATIAREPGLAEWAAAFSTGHIGLASTSRLLARARKAISIASPSPYRAGTLMSRVCANWDYIMEGPARGTAARSAKVDPVCLGAKKYLAHRVLPWCGGPFPWGAVPGGHFCARSSIWIHPSGQTESDISRERLQQAREREIADNSRVQFVLRRCGRRWSFSVPTVFDLSTCRYVAPIPEGKGKKAVSEMARVCQALAAPFLLQDLDGQLLWHYPEDPQSSEPLKKVCGRLWPTTAFDPLRRQEALLGWR